MEAGRAALQDYLAKVDAYVDPEEAGSAELAEALGEPVSSWEGAPKPEKAAPSKD